MLLVKDITVRFGDRILLDNVSFSLRPGEKVALIGRNGTGKSTMLKLIAGMFEPDSGIIDRPSSMAYLKQGKTNLAGPLFAAIAKDDDVPQTLRSRTRQLAGLLGYDAVENVDETLAEMRNDEQGADAPAPPAAQ